MSYSNIYLSIVLCPLFNLLSLPTGCHSCQYTLVIDFVSSVFGVNLLEYVYAYCFLFPIDLTFFISFLLLLFSFILCVLIVYASPEISSLVPVTLFYALILNTVFASIHFYIYFKTFYTEIIEHFLQLFEGFQD